MASNKGKGKNSPGKTGLSDPTDPRIVSDSITPMISSSVPIPYSPSSSLNTSPSPMKSPPSSTNMSPSNTGTVSPSTMKNKEMDYPQEDLRVYCSRCKKAFKYESSASKFDLHPRVLSCEHLACLKCNEVLVLHKNKCSICHMNVKFVPMVTQLKKLTKIAIAINNPGFLNLVFKIHNDYLTDVLDLVDSRLLNSSQPIPLLKNLQSYVQNYDEKILLLRDEFDDVSTKFTFLKEKFCMINSTRHFDIGRYAKSEHQVLLDKIMEKLAKGEKLYVASTIKHTNIKYGKVSLFKDFGILVNAVSLDEIEDDASFFWLQEFKQIFFNHMNLFLTFPCTEATVDGNIYTVIFQIIDRQRESGFIELCTGERGNSFTNSEYTKMINDATFHIKFLKKYDFRCKGGDFEPNEGETVINFIPPKKCEIKKIEKTLNKPSAKGSPRRSVVARLNHDIDFSTLYPSQTSERKIIESGVGIFKYKMNYV